MDTDSLWILVATLALAGAWDTQKTSPPCCDWLLPHQQFKSFWQISAWRFQSVSNCTSAIQIFVGYVLFCGSRIVLQTAGGGGKWTGCTNAWLPLAHPACPHSLAQRHSGSEEWRTNVKPKKSSSRLFRRGCIKKWRRVSRIISGEYCVNKIFIALKYVLILFLVRKVCLHFKNYFSECVWLLLLVSNYEDLSISKLYEVLPENCKKKKI